MGISAFDAPFLCFRNEADIDVWSTSMANLKTHEPFNPDQRRCAGVLAEGSRGESACPATVQGNSSAQKSSKKRGSRSRQRIDVSRSRLRCCAGGQSCWRLMLDFS